MGWFSDIVNTVGDAVQQVVDTVDHAINVAADHPVEAAALAAGGYYGYGALTAESGAVALAPVSDAVAFTPEQILAKSIPDTVSVYGSGNAGFEFAAPSSVYGSGNAGFEFAAPSAPVSESFLPNISGKDILTATNTGLNLATAGVKLATVANTGKLMNANTATANGLTGALGMSPIQTPSGLITTTPQGPVVAGTSTPATTGGMMDSQTTMVIVGAAIGIYFLSKYSKG
jgi:hypothetical protein